jgi:fibronectin-binding autotransporter adhesin
LTINRGVFKTGRGFVNASAISSGAAATTGSGNLVITNNGTLVFSAGLNGLMTSVYGATNYFRIGAANIDNGGYDIVLPDNIINVSGQVGALTILNIGTVTLSGTNTYTGETIVSGGGKLIVNGSLASSNLIVNAGTTLGGTGLISGSIAVAGTISPGVRTNVATLNTGAETWSNGGNYEFSVKDTANGTAQDLLK